MISPHISDDNSWSNLTLSNASLDGSGSGKSVNHTQIQIHNLTLSNASLVGAKTVNGPADARVSTRPAALTAANRVENLKIQIIMKNSWVSCPVRGRIFGGINVGDLYGVDSDSSRFAGGFHGIMHISATT